MSDSSDVPESFEFERLEKSVSPSSSWKKRSKDFASESSFGAFLYGFSGESWVKRIIWAVIVVAAVGGFCIVTILNILMLVSEPISTSITLTREKQLVFPAVTICSLNLLNTTTLESAGSNVIPDLTGLFAAVQDDSDLASCQQYANSLTSMTMPPVNPGWGELINLAGNDFNTLLLNCTYAGKKCTSDDFKRISTVGGLCYTFNGPLETDTRYSNGTGVRRGLRLQLSPDDQEFSLGQDYGFRVVIHNRDELPRPESDGVAVALNSTAYIGMRQVNSVDKSQFTSATRCRNDATQNTGLSFEQFGYDTYSPSLCLEACFYRCVIDKCNCTETLLYSPASGQYRQRNCSAVDLCCEVYEFGKVEEDCDCPPKCNMVERTLTVSSATNQKGVVGINVFYESLFLERRETTDSYTPWSLISDIGGNTGLFLGLTLLSWVELFLFVCGLL